MTQTEIPERSTSRYMGQYAGSSDPLRLLQILIDSNRIALSSKDPETAQTRFELAIEAYHQMKSLRLTPDLEATVENLLSSLVVEFPAKVCLNQAAGLRAKAAKLKTEARKLACLTEAKDILNLGLSTIAPDQATAIKRALTEVLTEMNRD